MPIAKSALAHQPQNDVPGSAAALHWKLRMQATRFRDFTLRITGYLPTSTIRRLVYCGVFSMKIAPTARIESGCVIWGPGRITIGEGTVINRNVVLDGRFPLTIGAHASISLQTIILTLEHDLFSPGFTSVGAPVSIGDRVFIGARALILPGITIGEGAAVAAGSVVAKDVDPYSIVAGVPAKPIGERPRNLTYRFA